MNALGCSRQLKATAVLVSDLQVYDSSKTRLVVCKQLFLANFDISINEENQVDFAGVMVNCDHCRIPVLGGNNLEPKRTATKGKV